MNYMDGHTAWFDKLVDTGSMFQATFGWAEGQSRHLDPCNTDF